VFSGTLLLELVRVGLGRDEAYRIVQAASHEALEGGRHLREVALETAPIRDRLGREGVERAFDLQHHLRHVDAIFERTLREEGT
jgi:adenylosuccinate lyase